MVHSWVSAPKKKKEGGGQLGTEIPGPWVERKCGLFRFIIIENRERERERGTGRRRERGKRKTE